MKRSKKVWSFFQSTRATEEFPVEDVADLLDADETTEDRPESPAWTAPHERDLAKEYFLAVCCEREACSKILFEGDYKFCPKCGTTTVPVYDYYRLFDIDLRNPTFMGFLAEPERGLPETAREQLGPRFREWSRVFHPDALPLHMTAAPTQPPQSTEGEDQREQHENFAFLSLAYETLRQDGAQLAYHRLYWKWLTHTQGDLAGALLAAARSEMAMASGEVSSDPASVGGAGAGIKPRSWKQRLAIYAVGTLDLLVTAGIILVVTRAYLWGAVGSLIGAWMYFRVTRRFLHGLEAQS